VESTFDPKKNAANLRKHGVPLPDGDGVLNDPLALTVEDHSSVSEQRFVSIGTNVFGQLVSSSTCIAARACASSRCGNRSRKRFELMKKAIEFSKGKRGAVLPQAGKTRITIYLDDAVVERFKQLSEKSGKGYQTLINEALRASLGMVQQPLTADVVRKIIREELAHQA
jgi:uncharacterized protein (DUF4415 family)